MPETFKCPSCSAPLDFEGSPYQKCKFCGSSVIVPSETFQRTGTKSFRQLDLSSLTGKALKIAEIQKEIERGNKIEAIRIFRETFQVGLEEAEDAVEAMERGEGFDVSGMQIQTPAVQTRPLDIDAKIVKKIGFTIGGSILATTLIISIFVLIIIGIVVAVTVYSIQSAVNETSDTEIESSMTTQAAEEIAKFGGEGTGAGKFKDNRSVAVDGKDRVYSANYHDGKIQVFDANGKFLRQWIADREINLYAMAADRRGNLYIAQNKSISVYDGESGELLRKHEERRVKDLALTADEKIVASIYKGIKIFDKELNLIKAIDDASEQASSSFGFSKIAVDGNGVIYAVDSTGGEICKFSAEGKFLNRYKTEIRSPNGIAVNNRGHIYISDTSKIYIFDENFNKLSSFDTTQAFGMAFNTNDDLYVAARPFIIKYKINPDAQSK